MSFTIPFQQLSQKDGHDAGGKGANLAAMIHAGFPVPPGFVLTTAAYRSFVDHNDLQEKIIALATSDQALEQRSQQVRSLFEDGEWPQAVKHELLQAYQNLGGNRDTAVAVRSSATAEDLPTASFAGQQETFLNVQGEWALLNDVKWC